MYTFAFCIHVFFQARVGNLIQFWFDVKMAKAKRLNQAQVARRVFFYVLNATVPESGQCYPNQVTSKSVTKTILFMEKLEDKETPVNRTLIRRPINSFKID